MRSSHSFAFSNIKTRTALYNKSLHQKISHNQSSQNWGQRTLQHINTQQVSKIQRPMQSTSYYFKKKVNSDLKIQKKSSKSKSKKLLKTVFIANQLEGKSIGKDVDKGIDMIKGQRVFRQSYQKRVSEKNGSFYRCRIVKMSQNMDTSKILAICGCGGKASDHHHSQTYSQQDFQYFQQPKYYIDSLKNELKSIQNFKKYSKKGKQSFRTLQHFFQTINCFHRYKDVNYPQQVSQSVFVPKLKQNHTTLVFDMDETLIHAQPYNQESHNKEWGQVISVHAQNEQVLKIIVKLRPFCLQVLKRLKKHFQIGLFTAANQDYAQKVVEMIDPKKEIFDFCLFRQHCHSVNNDKLFVKDMRVINNRSIQNLVLIDNSPHTYLFQPQNAIPILSFYQDPQDQELLKLQKFIKQRSLQKKEDVRLKLKNYFNIEKYTHYSDMNQMIQSLFGQ